MFYAFEFSLTKAIHISSMAYVNHLVLDTSKSMHVHVNYTDVSTSIKIRALA